MSIVIAGYYGFGNAGDELILLSLICRFQKESPGDSIVVLSKTPRETRDAFGVGACDRWRPWTWVRPFLEAKRFALGGGGLLQESSGPWNHLYYLSLVMAASLFGCRTEVIAIGVDPIKGRANRFLTRFVLNHWADDLSVRDEDSRQALRDAGVRSPISIQADPVSDLTLERSTASRDRIGLVVSPSKANPRWAYEVSQFCDRISEQLKIPVDFLVFFPYEDEVYTREIAAISTAVTHVRVWQKPEDLLTWITEYRLVIATRFHALVLAASSGIPFIGWGAQKKVASFCRAHHMPYMNTELIWNEDEQFSQVAELYQSNRKSVILATRTD